MEHSPRNEESLRYILWMVRDTPTVALVRVKDNRPDELKQALDHGANGVVVPLIESVDDARRAVAGCKYPPTGVRGYGPFMPSFGWNDLAYHSTANEETVVFVQVEHYRAVNVIEEIAALEGVDGFFIGPNDLTPLDGHIRRVGERGVHQHNPADRARGRRQRHSGRLPGGCAGRRRVRYRLGQGVCADDAAAGDWR